MVRAAKHPAVAAGNGAAAPQGPGAGVFRLGYARERPSHELSPAPGRDRAGCRRGWRRPAGHRRTSRPVQRDEQQNRDRDYWPSHSSRAPSSWPPACPARAEWRGGHGPMMPVAGEATIRLAADSGSRVAPAGVAEAACLATRVGMRGGRQRGGSPPQPVGRYAALPGPGALRVGLAPGGIPPAGCTAAPASPRPPAACGGWRPGDCRPLKSGCGLAQLSRGRVLVLRSSPGCAGNAAIGAVPSPGGGSRNGAEAKTRMGRGWARLSSRSEAGSSEGARRVTRQHPGPRGEEQSARGDDAQDGDCRPRRSQPRRATPKPSFRGGRRTSIGVDCRPLFTANGLPTGDQLSRCGGTAGNGAAKRRIGRTGWGLRPTVSVQAAYRRQRRSPTTSQAGRDGARGRCRTALAATPAQRSARRRWCN